ncbi:MAG: hypothetical protein IJ158_06625 [Treponema sp.]|nr:hypothetical protein [Treponema sp.]
MKKMFGLFGDYKKIKLVQGWHLGSPRRARTALPEPPAVVSAGGCFSCQ